MKRRAQGGFEPSTKALKFQNPPSEERKNEFTNTLRALNTQFASWVARQAADHPSELWSLGVEDYVSHARGLLVEYDDVIASTTVAAAASTAGQSGESPPARISTSREGAQPSTFGASMNGASSVPAPSAGGSLFLRPITTGVKADPGLSAPSSASILAPANTPPPLFGALTSNSTPAPMFGALASSTASGSFFSAPAANGAPAASANPFVWNAAPASQPLAGGASTFSTASAPAATNGVGGDAADEDTMKISKSEVVIDESDAGLLFRNKCRLFLQTSGEKKSWDDRGTGTVTLRLPHGGGSAYVVWTTEAGRVLLNARLYKGMKLQVQTKNVMIALPADSSDGGAAKLTLTLFLLPNLEKANAFADLCKQHTPQ